MRLRQLEIEQFRGFSKPARFELDANIILLVGGNGFGKTTFFDAFEWCLTGSLQRYVSSKIEQSRYPHIVNSDSNGPAKAKITFVDNSNEIVFIRSGDEQNTKLEIIINGLAVDEKEVSRKKMEILIGDPVLVKQINDEDLPYLLLRSHVLTQEHTAEFIRSLTPTARFSQLNKILGTDRFESFYKRIVGTYKYIDDKIIDKERERDQIVSKITDKNKQLEEEKIVIEKRIDNEEGFIKEELQRLHKKALTFFPDLELSDSIFVSQELENLLSLSIAYSERLSLKINTIKITLEQDMKELESLLKQQVEADESSKASEVKLKKIEQDLETKKTKIENQKRKIGLLQNQLEKSQLKLNQISKKAILINELNEEVDSYLKNKKKGVEISEEIKSTTSAIGDLFSKEKSLNDDLMNSKQKISELIRNKNLTDKQIDKWAFLKENLRIFLDITGKFSKTKEKLKIDNEKIQKDVVEVKKIDTEINKLESSKKSLEYEYKIELAKDNEHKQLLNEIKKFISNSICPTCGYNWKDENTLKEQIERLSVATDKDVVQKQANISDITKKIEVLNRELLVKRSGLSDSQAMIIEEQNLCDSLLLKKNKFSEQLKYLQVKKEDLLLFDENTIIKELENSQKNSENIAEKISDSERQQKDVESKISSIATKISALEQRKKIQQQSLHSLNEDIINYKEKADTISLSIGDLRKDKLAILLAEILDSKKVTEDKNRETSDLIQNAEEEYSDLKKAITESEEISYRLKNEKSQNLAILNNCQKQLKKFNLEGFTEIKKEVTKKDRILEDINEFSTSASQLFHILKYMSNKRKMIDLKKELLKLEEQRKGVEIEIEYIRKAKNFAEKINKKARKETALLVDKLMKGHEALINNFYSQISAHPIFKSINFVIERVRGFGGMNAIFIETKDETGKKMMNPNLTFSSAQLNVLAISVFLAIHRKQVWSTLDTLFMDDPIQNMDDLNILSYIDLIRKICKQKQIIVSTHDDNIFHLMRRKLYPMGGDKLISYYYKGFGSDGPEIEKAILGG